MFKALVFVLVFVAASGCSSPPPAPGTPLDLKVMVGEWRGDHVHLVVDATGAVNYEKVDGSNKRTVSGMQLSKLTTTGFDVGVGFLGMHFVFNNPPSGTTMTVDGTVLTKVEPAP